jgi:surface antigen
MERPVPAVIQSVQVALTANTTQPNFKTQLDSLHQWQAEQARLAELAAQEAARKTAEAEAARQAWLHSIAGRVHPYGSFDASSYGWGQCVFYVASRINVPPFLGNANQWGYTLGWSVHENPVVGAIAWTTAGYYGHVAVTEAVGDGQVLISEMNYAGAVGVVDYRWVPVSEFSYLY